MCDYSLESVASRPAKVGDRLVSTQFPGSYTRGFAAAGEPEVAVCLLPGTEIAFDAEAEQDVRMSLMGHQKVGSQAARFRHVDEGQPYRHHDALEFSNGKIVLLTDLRRGQAATVLQLPVDATQEEPRKPAVEPIPVEIQHEPVRSWWY